MAEKIKVTTEKLRSGMERLETAGMLAKKDFEEACREGETLKDCFDAEAVRFFERALAKEEELGKAGFEQLLSQIRKLEDIATVYEKAEGGNMLVTTEN